MIEPAIVRLEGGAQPLVIYDFGVEFDAAGVPGDVDYDGRRWRFHEREKTEHAGWPVPSVVLVFRAVD